VKREGPQYRPRLQGADLWQPLFRTISFSEKADFTFNIWWWIMTKNEIVEQIIVLLRNHKEGRSGSIHQDPYKHDFFALFAEAYNAEMVGSDNVLYADALADAIIERAPELAEGLTWQILHRFWAEWTYAWDHAGERRRAG